MYLKLIQDLSRETKKKTQEHIFISTGLILEK